MVVGILFLFFQHEIDNILFTERKASKIEYIFCAVVFGKFYFRKIELTEKNVHEQYQNERMNEI